MKDQKQSTRQVLAFSGGNDSTATALRMAELGESFSCLFTPTGNELANMQGHIESIVRRIGCDLIIPENKSLDYWINFYNGLPGQIRWCTRLIKIEPCIAYLKQHPGSTLVVGLRADEEQRTGLYGEYARYRYPLREWGWKKKDVRSYLKQKGVTVPTRTDCALCPYQKLAEWYSLWKNHPEEWRKGEQYEAKTGHTFRSPGRDTWPASMQELRGLFEAGHIPSRARKARQLSIFEDDAPDACRVCSL